MWNILHSNKDSDKKLLATETSIQWETNIRNRRHQPPIIRHVSIQELLKSNPTEESLTNSSRPVSFTEHVSSTKVLPHRLIGTCSGRPQNCRIRTHSIYLAKKHETQVRSSNYLRVRVYCEYFACKSTDCAMNCVFLSEYITLGII